MENENGNGWGEITEIRRRIASASPEMRALLKRVLTENPVAAYHPVAKSRVRFSAVRREQKATWRRFR